MKEDKELNNILDECLERIVLGGESLEQCLRRYPARAAELRPLLETVLAVKSASAVEPRPEFKARARYQFRSALGEKAAPQRRPFFGWLPRWATALTIVIVVLLAGVGTVAAASNSMPDSILYPVKLATEKVQLAFNTSPLGRAQLCADFADERVEEIIYMAEKGDAEQVEAVTGRLESRLVLLAELASELEGTDAEVVFDVASEGAGEEAIAPVTITPEETLGWVDQGQAQNRAGLKLTVEDAAYHHQAEMEAMLDSVPESVKEALLEAIEVSAEGYQKVLEALD